MRTIISKHGGTVRWTRVRRSWVACGFWVVCAARASAQSAPIVAGVVTDSSSGVGISSAEVRVEGDTRAVYTNEKGEFRLPIPATARQIGQEGRHPHDDAAATAALQRGGAYLQPPAARPPPMRATRV